MTRGALAVFPELGLAAMQDFARRLAGVLKPGDCITLSGEVGAGKTAFAQALIGAIAEDTPEVTSPTFTLMQSYDVVCGTLWHLDLYRLEEESELMPLGLEELWPHVVLIEWPEIAARLLPPERLAVAFAFGASPETRTLTLDGNETWRERLRALV